MKSKKKPVKNGSIDAGLALKFRCDERTIRRWRKAKAPFQDEKRMRTWLAGQKHLPAGTAALLEATRTTERAQSASSDKPGPEGAANALRRTEQAEAQAYVAFKRATASGDDVAIKTTRENWLRISESLRRYDLAVERDRRESGDLVPRDEMLRLCYALHDALYFARFSYDQLCPGLIGLKAPAQAWEILDKAWNGIKATILEQLDRAPRNPIPRWMIQAVKVGQFPVPSQNEQWITFGAALSQLIDGISAEAKAQFAQKLSTAPAASAGSVAHQTEAQTNQPSKS